MKQSWTKTEIVSLLVSLYVSQHKPGSIFDGDVVYYMGQDYVRIGSMWCVGSEYHVDLYDYAIKYFNTAVLERGLSLSDSYLHAQLWAEAMQDAKLRIAHGGD